MSSDIGARVTKATGYVYIRELAHPPILPQETMMLVYILQPSKKTWKRHRIGKIIAKKNITLRAGPGRWQSFDLTFFARIWQQRPSRNLGLKIVLNDFNGNSLAIIVPRNDLEEPYVSFLAWS